MPDWISHEPVAWTTLLTVMVDAALAFGLPITIEQRTTVIALVTALAAIFIRQQVWPAAKIDEVPVAKAALLQVEKAKS